MSRSLSAEVKRQRRCSLEAWGNARATPQEPCADTASAESATHHDRASIPPKASLVSRLDLRLHLQKRLASTNECQRRIVVNNSPDFARLFRNTLGALLLCAVLVLLCYLFVDPPFPFFVHDHRFADYAVWKWLIYPPPVLQAWAPVVLAGLMVRRVYGHFRRWELAVLVACVTIILVEQFRLSVACAFGRYWPITWIKDNPSLIRDGVYGFHPFHGASSMGASPQATPLGRWLSPPSSGSPTRDGGGRAGLGPWPLSWVSWPFIISWET
jgi:hypothetical protein